MAGTILSGSEAIVQQLRDPRHGGAGPLALTAGGSLESLNAADTVRHPRDDVAVVVDDLAARTPVRTDSRVAQQPGVVAAV